MLQEPQQRKQPQRRTAPQGRPNRNECYISVDIEAAGPAPATYSMLSLGACVVAAPERTFYAELRPITHHALRAALQVSGFSLEHLAVTGRDPSEVMRAFRDWILQVAAGQVPVCVGFNASFDWGFINWYFHEYLGENPFGIGALDIKAYYMGLAGCPWQETTSHRLPIEFQPQHPQTHNALDDALAQGTIFAKLLSASHSRE